MAELLHYYFYVMSKINVNQLKMLSQYYYNLLFLCNKHDFEIIFRLTKPHQLNSHFFSSQMFARYLSVYLQNRIHTLPLGTCSKGQDGWRGEWEERSERSWKARIMLGLVNLLAMLDLVCIQYVCILGKVNLFICVKIHLFFQDIDIMEQGI